MSTLHSDLAAGEIHVAYQWIYADAAARTGAGGFVAGDVGKFAIQSDTNTIWILTATTPTWIQVGGSGSDANAVHVNASSEISGITEKTTPVAADLVIIEDSEDSNAKKKVQVGNLGGASAPNRAYFKYLAARLEPLALEAAQAGSFTYSLAAGTPKILVASYNTKLGTSGRMEARNPQRPLILNTGLSLAGLGADASAILIDPSLPTYADAEATYYSRLNLLASNSGYAQKACNLSAAQTVQFLAGPYGSLIVQVTSFDYDWIIAHTPANKGWNLWDEIGDSTIERLGNALFLPVSKNTICNLQSTGAGGTGTVLYVILPSTWGAVTDPNSYAFRDDFMGATLDTATNWTRAESSAGNMEIDTVWQWLKCIGDGTWAHNGVYSQASYTKANGKVFLIDVALNSTWDNTGFGMVGFSDGGGQSYTNMAYALNFGANVGSPQLNVFENGNARGAVGSAFTLGLNYRVRITAQGAGTAGAKYEIQGGTEYAAIGGATWTDITPGTTSSATTTLHAGITMFSNTMRCSDARLY